MPLSTPAGIGLPVTHRAWMGARELALAAVRAGGGLVLLLGPPGTGKSLLLRDLTRALEGDGYEVLLRVRGDIPIEPASADKGRPRVVLVDEADRMSRAALEQLAQLDLHAIVLAGLTGPAESIEGLPETVVRLLPLHPDEVGAFAAARLARAGRQALPLDEGAVARLAECSGGVPRVLAMLVDAAAFLATTDGAACIGAQHVDEAAAMRGGAGLVSPTLPADPAVPPPRVPEAPMPSGPVPDAPVLAAPVPSVPASSQPAPPGAGQGSRALLRLASWGRKPSALLARATPRRPRLSGRSWPVLGTAAAGAALCALLAFQSRPPAPEAPPAPQPPAAASVPPGGDTQATAAVEAPPALLPAPAAPVAQPSAGAGGTEALPAGAPAHVAILYLRGEGDARAAGLARLLREAGMAVDDPVAAPRRVGSPRVRYFFAEDRDMARAVAEVAGLPVRPRLAGARGGSLPRPGLIEITLPPG